MSSIVAKGLRSPPVRSRPCEQVAVADLRQPALSELAMSTYVSHAI